MAKRKGAAKPEVIHQFCTFWIGERLYGADILEVKEINSERNICPIPHAPKEIMGYVNIRGQIHLIIDMRRRLGVLDEDISKESRLVLFKHSGGDAYGILVDRIGDVIEVGESQIEEQASSTDSATGAAESSLQFMSGICQLDKQLLIVIDPNRLLRLVCQALSDATPEAVV